MTQWMIYGATGYTGTLLAEEAVRRGHRPLLAGRSKAKLEPLARRLGLDYAAFALNDVFTPTGATAGFDLVLHAAGPFTYTCAPMLHACLTNGAHYLDITGELNVFQHVFGHDVQARDKGIALIPGVGFDIVPSDCLALYVAQQVPKAVTLETVVRGLGEVSVGTVKSTLEILGKTGNVIRRGGQLIPVDLGSGMREFTLMDGPHMALPIPWGDVETAYRSTGIPNITAYFVLKASPLGRALLPAIGFIGQTLAKSSLVRGLAGRVMDTNTEITAADRERGRCYLYARAADASGSYAEAWLETCEAYKFTALSAIRAVEKTLELKPVGALTPALAFGADFVLDIAGTQRRDSLS
ncbi:MAG: saccharopine dehydrogenase NADP-binding domain-containing protein [Anaerolineae bacterium]